MGQRRATYRQREVILDTSLKFTVNVTTYFIIPTTGGGYLYDVDWGDGNQSLAQTGDVSHSYGSSGEYQITITGAFPRFYFNNTWSRLQLKSIDQWGDVGYSGNQTNAFYGCGNLETIADDVSWFDSIVYGTRMFRGCTSLTALPSSSHFASLVNGEEMFRDTYSMVLNEGLNFPLLQNGNSLFRTRVAVPVNIPDSLVFGSLTTANQAFYNTLMSAADYSKLLINIDANNSNTGVTFGAEGCNYNSTAVTARNNLTSTKSWTINDAGLV